MAETSAAYCSSVAEEGVYRWTRNPMYVGFVTIAAGAAVASGLPLARLGPGVLTAYLDRVEIPTDETALRARFGAPFESYARTGEPLVGSPQVHSHRRRLMFRCSSTRLSQLTRCRGAAR